MNPRDTPNYTGLILRLNIVFVLTLTLALLAAVLGVIWSMPDLPNVYASDLCLRLKHKGQLAGEVTCDHNSLETFAKQRIADHYEKSVEEYTTDTADDEIISLKSYIKQHVQDLKPVARLTGDYTKDEEQKQLDESTKNSNNSLKLIPVRKWTSLRDLVYTGGIRRFGVHIKNGRIIVPVGGDYEIYSFIHFRESCIDGVPQVDNPNIPVKQSIFKFDILDGKDEELITSCQPHKISQNYYVNMYGIFLSSVARLKAGDELSVKVSNISFLQAPTFNYFGAHLIE